MRKWTSDNNLINNRLLCYAFKVHNDILNLLLPLKSQSWNRLIMSPKGFALCCQNIVRQRFQFTARYRQLVSGLKTMHLIHCCVPLWDKYVSKVGWTNNTYMETLWLVWQYKCPLQYSLMKERQNHLLP